MSNKDLLQDSAGSGAMAAEKNKGGNPPSFAAQLRFSLVADRRGYAPHSSQNKLRAALGAGCLAGRQNPRGNLATFIYFHRLSAPARWQDVVGDSLGKVVGGRAWRQKWILKRRDYGAKKAWRREGIFSVDSFIKDGGRTGICHDMPA
jgi:hypothetical protein